MSTTRSGTILARVLQLNDEGEIVVDKPTLNRVRVRFPTEAEQAAGMTEVPRSTRLEEDPE